MLIILPVEIIHLILDFHDRYNTVDRRNRINSIIRIGYTNWLLDEGIFSRFCCATEFQSKEDIYPMTRGNIFVSNSMKFKIFLNYFKRCEYYNRSSLQRVYIE